MDRYTEHTRRAVRLNLQEVLDAFPEEAKTLVPCSIYRLKRSLKSDMVAYEEHYYKALNYFTHSYAKELAMSSTLKKKIDHLKSLQIMQAVMRGDLDKIGADQIAQAREVKISGLYTFQKIRKARDGFMACCPFGHTDNTPSFSVKKNHFHCFSCDAHGDAIDFFMKVNRVKFVEAVKFLIKR